MSSLFTNAQRSEPGLIQRHVLGFEYLGACGSSECSDHLGLAKLLKLLRYVGGDYEKLGPLTY